MFRTQFAWCCMTQFIPVSIRNLQAHGTLVCMLFASRLLSYLL